MFLRDHVSQLGVLTCPHKAVRYAAGGHTIVEPVPETVESILYEILGCSEVEPRIDYHPMSVNCSITTALVY